jgi:ribosome-binding factor A
MPESRRQKKVASLIHETLSRLLIETIQDSRSGLITITRVEMSPDLRTAHVYLTQLGQAMDESVLEILNSRRGYLRKSVASQTNLKYNPMLIFLLDPSYAYEKKIDKILKNLKNEG